MSGRCRPAAAGRWCRTAVFACLLTQRGSVAGRMPVKEELQRRTLSLRQGTSHSIVIKHDRHQTQEPHVPGVWHLAAVGHNPSVWPVGTPLLQQAHPYAPPHDAMYCPPQPRCAACPHPLSLQVQPPAPGGGPWRQQVRSRRCPEQRGPAAAPRREGLPPPQPHRPLQAWRALLVQPPRACGGPGGGRRR